MSHIWILSLHVGHADVLSGWLEYKNAMRMNSLAPGRCSCNLTLVIFKLILISIRIMRIDLLSTACEIELRWIPQDLIYWSTLVQVMACRYQATSHHLSQCWPRSMLPCDFTTPQWVPQWRIPHHKEFINTLRPEQRDNNWLWQFILSNAFLFWIVSSNGLVLNGQHATGIAWTKDEASHWCIY